jgi:demethylmenaquinone methyltransferase / 2-methoxy-6-polyprenyl-1,4-benzoquinol methylase
MAASPTAPPLPAPHRPLTEFYGTPARRTEYVANLFNHSAPDYDWVSSLLAFGQDRTYRKTALFKAGLRPGMRMLDVATGTGLVARAALEIGLSPAHIVGVDPSCGMLAENRQRTGISLFRGFGERLPFRDESFDFISMGYALRHVESLNLLFTELKRVLKPGGTILILEISRPRSRLLQSVLRLYMQQIVPFIARFRSNKPELLALLRYYWATIEECVPPEKIVFELSVAGFQRVERRQFGPVLYDYLAQK